MKPQAIKTAYITEFVNSGMSEKEAEQKWNEISSFVDENGWIKDRNFRGNTAWFPLVQWELTDYDDDYNDKRRPFLLRELKTNNGWTRIESEKDLPNADSHTLFEICVKGKNKGILVDSEFIRKSDSAIKITHYKKYEPTPDPIF